jgi:hypothetical protein
MSEGRRGGAAVHARSLPRGSRSARLGSTRSARDMRRLYQDILVLHIPGYRGISRRCTGLGASYCTGMVSCGDLWLGLVFWEGDN